MLISSLLLKFSKAWTIRQYPFLSPHRVCLLLMMLPVFLRLKITIISRNGRGHHGKNQVLYSEGIKKAVPEH
jgi:hypothetical protein